MYTQVYEQMVEAKVVFELSDPIWMNDYGNEVLKNGLIGCKVTHVLILPEMCIVMDEVGGNISQKGDGNNGGHIFVKKEWLHNKKANLRDRHSTMLGLTTLSGDAVICVIIFSGKRGNGLLETGIDVFAKTYGDVSDTNYFERNSSANKRLPGGPTCKFQGKEVPCLTRWSDKGSITSVILVNILGTLDHIGVFDRSNGKLPSLLLDGHGSRLGLEFLKYINNSSHE